MHFYKKYVPLTFCSQLVVFFSYIIFDLFYTDLIHLFDTGSVLLSLSADHL